MSESRICPTCGTGNPPHARFCKHDGTRLEAEGPAALPAEPRIAEGPSAAQAVAPPLPLPVRPAAVAPPGRPPAAVRALFAPAAALLLAPIVVFSVAAAAGPGSALRELVLPEHAATPGWIPGAIVFLAIWVLIDVASRALVAARETAGQREGERLDLVGVFETQGPVAARARLGANAAARRGAWGRRVGALLDDLADGLDPLRAQAQFRHASSLEAEAAASAHRLERRLASSMALLGGVGTAAAGVAGAPALELAPLLLGLAGALVALLASAAVEAQEEAVRGAVDALGLGLVRRAPPCVPPAPRSEAREPGAAPPADESAPPEGG